MNNSCLNILLILAITTALTIRFSHAQVSSQSQSTHKYKDYVQPYDLKLYREVAGQKQQTYDQHTELIQSKINTIFQRLDDLETLNSDLIRLIKKEVSKYVNSLSNTRIDYSSSQSYNTIMSALNSYNGNIDYAIREANSSSNSKSETYHTTGSSDINRIAKTFTYAPIFQRPDLSSPKVHSVDDKETVTILREEGSFYYVKCSTYEGYLSKGMIERFLR